MRNLRFTLSLFTAMVLLAALLFLAPAQAETRKSAAGPEINSTVTEYAVPAIGNEWTYRCIGENETVTHKVTGRKNLDGADAYKYEIYFDKDLVNIRYATRVMDKVLVLLEQDPETSDMITYTPPRIGLKIPLKIGDTWSSEFQDIFGDLKKETYTVVKRETITVPAGTFDTFFVDVTIASQKSQEPPAKLKVWYAPGVGMVKQAVSEDLSQYEMVLEKYTIKKTVPVKE